MKGEYETKIRFFKTCFEFEYDCGRKIQRYFLNRSDKCKFIEFLETYPSDRVTHLSDLKTHINLQMEDEGAKIRVVSLEINSGGIICSVFIPNTEFEKIIEFYKTPEPCLEY